MSSDLTTGPVPAHLRRQAIPMGLGLIAIISFDAVDLFFVSRLGDLPLAAISFCFPVLWLLTSVIIGFEAGAASTISRAVGRNDQLSARRQTTDTAALAGLVVAALCLGGLFTISPVFGLLGATPEVMPFVQDYMEVWYWSAPVSAVTWICLASMRARGNTMLEGKIIIIAAAVNAILDPIMIFGLFGFPRLEIAGAAWATLTANVLILLGALTYLHFSLHIFATPFTHIRNVMDSWGRMLHVGLPAMLTNAIVPLANGIIVAMLATYGVDEVAGFGIAIRIEPIALIAFYAMSAITSPFMGQNIAAHKFGRLDEARRAIGRFAIVYGLILSVALAVLAAPLAALFSDTESIQTVAVEYLWIMVISYAGYGVVMSMCAGFNGIGDPLPGVAISVSRAFVVFLPLAFVGQMIIGMNGIFVAAAISNLVLGLAAYTWFGRHIRRDKANYVAQAQT